jgi:TP901 family phage tail tape measure protein
MAVQINVQASQTALAQSISQGVAAYNARFASQNQLNLQINPRTFSQPLGRITSDLADFESALKASNARVLAFGASTAVLGGSVKLFKEIANITIEIEKSLTDVNRVLGLSTSGLQKFSTELFSISKQTASSFDDATKAALEFSRQGLNTQETLKRTADALTLVRLTGISSRQAVEDLTSTINGFSKAGLTTSQVVNKLAAVEQDFAVSASDLTEALSRTGQAAQEAGVGFDELNALVTTAQQSTARGGAVIGNALKTIFTRLQRTDTLEQLENFNISVRDIEGNILPATQILKNFADQYKNLADSQRAQLSEQVAGVYQVNILKGIIGDLSNAQGTYTKALERGAMASNEADIANQKLNKTLSALSTQTGLGLQQLANNIGKVTFAPIFEAIVSPINDAVTYINETLEGEGPGSIFANGLLKGIRNVITGPGLAVAFAVIAKVAKNTFEDATKALPAILGITTEAQRRANIEKSILAILQTQSTLSLALQGQQGNATAQAATVLNYAKLQTAQYQQQLQIAQQLAPLLAAQNVTIGARGVQVGAKIKAGGHIPAFAEMSERMGAAMGGYKSGKVVKAPKSVGANTYMNTAEETKYVPGFAQPFINPPAGSKAGRAHRQNAINRTGVDPYMAGGFIPNFVKGVDSGARGKEFEKLINFYLIKEKTSAGSDLLDFNLPSNALTKASLNDKNKISLNSLSVYGDAKIKSTKETKRDLIKKLVGSLDSNVYAKLITHANKIKSDTINLNDFLLDKPSLISSKSSVTNDNLNSSIEAELGSDVIENLQRLLKNNKNTNRLTADSWRKKLKLNFIDDFVTIPDFSNSGFIPNFAIPMEAGRIPWFKKYSTLLKNTSGDKDLFRQKDFPTFGNGSDHFYATNGNNDMIGSLYEKFILSAMNIARNSSVFKTTKELGLKEFPVTDLGNTAAFDLGEDMGPEGLIGIQAKAGSKNNQTSGGGVNKTLTSNIERFGAQNPSRIKDLKKAVLIYNDPRYHDPTGKNPAGFLSPFEQTISGIVKPDYSSVDEALKPKLTKVTDDLLSYYEKNKNTKNAKSLFDGFIPNFNMGNRMRENMLKNNLRPILFDLANNTYGYSGQDGKEYLYHKDIYNNKLKTKGANVNDYDFAELHNLVRGFIYPTGQITWDYSDKQQEALKDSNIKAKVLAKLNTAKPKLATEKPKVLTRFQELKMRLAAQGEASDYARGFIPNFAGKDIATKFFRTQTGPELFPKGGTGLSGTVYRQPGYRSSGHQLKEQLNNMVMSILGNNVFFPDASSLNPKIYGDVNKGAENSAKTAALKLSSGGKTASLGLGTGMMSETFGNSRYVPDREAVFTGEVSGKMKRVNYDRLSDILGAFWSANPQTKSAWESLKNTSETGKFEEKQNIRAKTSLLKKAYEDFLIKNNYIGTRVKLSGYRKRAEGVEGANYGALRSDLAGVSNVRNIDSKYGGFIPNFAYKQAVMGLEESMSGNKAVLDTKSGPFPFIRNTSQSNFASAISDHGGLSNALSDSMRNQEAAGLMNKGYLPNFATINAQTAIGASFGSLKTQEQKEFLELNKALSQLARNTKLTTQQQQQYINTVMTNAASLAASTKSTTIVSEASKALATSLQQNQNAQKKAAAQTQAQARTQASTQAQTNVQNPTATGNRFTETFEKLSNNVAFSLGVPMLAGQLESAIQGNRDRSEMSYGERFASTGVSAGLTGATTGAMIGSAILPGFGSAVGAGVGAIVGLSGAAISARTSLDDLSKSIENVITRNKNDIESAKTIAALENQLASEKDPLNIEILKIKIAEAAEGIKNTGFAEKILQSSKSVDDFDKAIKEFTLKKKPIEDLQKLPSIIQSFSKATKTRSDSFDLSGTLGMGVFDRDGFNKLVKKANAIAPSYFKSFGNTLLNLENEIIKKNPQFGPQIKDIISNLNKYRTSGVLADKLAPLVDSGVMEQEFADAFVQEMKTVKNEYFNIYLDNIDNNLKNLRDSVKKEAAASTIRVQETESLKNVFAKINSEIQTALNEAALQLMNIEFKSNIGKLNIEKIGGIFDTAASAIGKNLESIAKAQFDALMVQVQSSRESQLADLNRTQFQETGTQEQNKYLAERRSRVSAFVDKNIAPGQTSRDNMVKALEKIGSDLSYDFKDLEKLTYKVGDEVAIARKELIKSEEFQKNSFLTQRSNAKTLFDQEQSFAEETRNLKKKISEEDLKLDQRRLDNALKEKQVIESFNFANQMIQAKTQADISIMGVGAEVNPNFYVGKSKFQQEDIRFRQEREKTSMQLAAGIRTSTNESILADFQQRILADNTSATIENTNAIKEATLNSFRQRKIELENAISNISQNLQAGQQFEITPASKAIQQLIEENYVEEKSILGTQFLSTDNTNPLNRALYLTNPADYQQPASLPDPNEPLPFGRQLLNAWTGNERKNQLPIETRRAIEYMNVENPLQSSTNESLSPNNKNIYDILDLNQFDISNLPQYTAKPIDDQRNKALTEQLDLQQKALTYTNQQLQATEGLLQIDNERNKSKVEQSIPDISLLGSAQFELNKLKDSQESLKKQKEDSLAQLNDLDQSNKNDIYTQNQKALLTNNLIQLNGQLNKTALDVYNAERNITLELKRQAEYAKYLASRGKFTTGVQKAMDTIKDETEMFKETLGTTTVNSFRDGLVGAMDAALNKADDLESALKGVAAGFLREIQGVMLRNIANSVVSSMGSAFSFGQSDTKQRGGFIRAQKGMYISGGRTGDKNPAMLEDGEYVLNRNAVQAMGGPSAIDQLNFNTFPRFATGGDPGSMSANVNLGRPFENLSGFGRDQSPEFQVYMEDVREAQAKKDKKKAERKALVNSLIATAVTTGVMMGISSGAKGFKSKTPLNKVAGSKPNFFQRMDLKKAGVSIGADGLPIMQTGGAVGFNQGGFLPYGSRLTDTIPAYLSGGEYVVNSRAVRKYGVGGLNRINSGVARFAEGGMVGPNQTEANNTSNSTDNNVSINITINANGNGDNKEEKDKTGVGTEGTNNELANRIKSVVLEVISNEQRTGGLLDSTKKR